MIDATRIQHPVGQGGLSSGVVHTGGRPLRWIYDCGSNQRDALRREIQGLPDEIDLLFLSHLDSDHINGIDLLLGHSRIHEVVLPYLSVEILLATAVKDAGLGSLSGTFLEAMPDPADWFGRRGVEIVTFVDGGDDPGEDRPPAGPLPFPEGPAEGDVSYEWSESPSVMSAGATGPIVQRVGPQAAIGLNAGSNPLNWALIPFVHPLSAAQRNVLVTSLESEFGSPLDLEAISKMALAQNGRARLRDCYDSLWMNNNLISMTLYSGPLKKEQFHTHHNLPQLDHYIRDAVGWMQTGDAHLNQKRRRGAYLNHYCNQIPEIRTLMLPHHGSARNFHIDLLRKCVALDVAFAASGPNSFGHPSESVRNAVLGRGRCSYKRVSNKANTTLAERVVSLK